MPSESLHDTPAPTDAVGPGETADQAEHSELAQPTQLPVDLSEFSQRLASFGLGETPDPLLTESRVPNKRKRR